MEGTDPSDDALLFFRALADGNRLRLLGLLARQPHSVEELAAILRLRPSTVSHHLGRLIAAELVQARAEGYYSVYALTPGAIERRARRFLGRRALRNRTAGLDLDAYDTSVVREITRPDGRLKFLPAQPRKRQAILRHLARSFRPGQAYGEAQVNRILRRFHADSTTLRQELVAAGLLTSRAGVYRRPET